MVKLSYSAEGACSLTVGDLSATQGQGNRAVLDLLCDSSVVGSNFGWVLVTEEASGVSPTGSERCHKGGEERSPATKLPQSTSTVIRTL